ncbi:hypothetical protein NS277_04360 [Novosphingobium barchaimii]|nr:hypothetical protein NS277_04360 [Novosphingobium barchaimii]
MIMFSALLTTGLEDLSGARFIRVSKGESEAILPRAAFTVSNRNLFAALGEQGVHLGEKTRIDDVIEKVSWVETFEQAVVPTGPGWCHGCYVLGDGAILQATEGPNIFLAFAPEAQPFETIGDTRSWRYSVGRPLQDQSLAMLAVMAMFVPPLMPFMPMVESFAIEFVGLSGTGKTTLNRVASSVIGGTGLASGPSYARLMASVMNDPAEQLKAYRDHAVVLEGVDAYHGTATLKQQRAAYNFFANELPALSRAGPGDALRTVALLSARHSLRDLAGVKADEVDSLLTFRIDADRPFGVFDTVPPPFANGAAFADALSAAATAQHGTIYRHFIAKLVGAASSDPTKLSDGLARLQADFIRHAEALNGGRLDKATRALSAVYAAGRYAQRLGLLPKRWDCLEAVASWYQFQRTTSASPVEPLIDVLERLIREGAIRSTSPGSKSLIQTLSAKATAKATLWTMADHREVRIRPDRLLELIPDWKAREKGTEVAELLIRGDGRHLRRKAAFTPGAEAQRLVCLRLPLISGDKPSSNFN